MRDTADRRRGRGAPHRPGAGERRGLHKIDRRALGHVGMVKLWPVNGSERLIVGEGIETVLAAATRIDHRGAPLTPAWSAVTKGGLARLPVLPGVTTLIQLVDNDRNGEGQNVAARGAAHGKRPDGRSCR